MLSVMTICMGCVREGPHYGCSAGSLDLIFTYGGNTSGFDSLVADDIELYLYDNNGKKMEVRHVPYETIRGGKPYSFEYLHTGNTHLVAWALSGDEDVDKAPLVFLDEENYSDIKFTMSSDRPTRQSQKYNGSSQELFVENLSFDSNPLERKVINVDVEKLLCNIIVTIEEGNLFKYQYPGKLSINITGSSNAYHVSKNKQSGNRIIIEDNLSYIESRNEYVSKNKVFPASVDSDSGLEDNIIVTILEDDVAKLRVDTDAKAQKGTQIDVVIKPTRQEVIISVDSWQIRKSIVRL